MMKSFFGKNNLSNYTLDATFTFVGNSFIVGQLVRADLYGTQLFGQIDLRKLRTSDFINKATFIFPIGAHNCSIRFKLFESNDYNFRTLSFNQISQSDLIDDGIVYDTVVLNPCSSDFYIEFDITRLMNKCLKEGMEKVCFRITNNTIDPCWGYNPNDDDNSEIVNGFFTITSEEGKQYDSISLNDLATSRVDIKTRKLKFDLPTINTKTRVCDVEFTGCIDNENSGSLGLYCRSNYEYHIRRDYDTQSRQPRYILENYRGVKSSYLLLKSEEIESEYGIVINSDDAYFNINDLSYLSVESNYIVINYKDESKVYFTYPILDNEGTLFIDHITRGNNTLEFIWSDSKLMQIRELHNNSNDIVVEYSYINDVINSVFFNNEKKLIKLEYTSGTSKITNYKIYKALYLADVDNNNILVDINFSYRPFGMAYLYKVNDNINDNYIEYLYADSISSKTITSVTHTMGIGDVINYSYNNQTNTASIKNKYNEYKKVVFDDLDEILLTYDNYYNYLGYSYNKTIDGTTLITKKEKEYKVFNIINNSKFENGLIGWEQQNIDIHDYIITNTILPSIIGTSVFQLSSSIIGEKKLFQTKQYEGIIGDSFFLSLWVKCTFSMHHTIKGFVTFCKSSDEEETLYFNACENTGDYQLLYGVAEAKICFNNIKVGIEYNGYNECEVGNIRCYKCKKGSEYIFSNEGKFDSVIIKGDEIEYRYDKEKVNRIISSTGDSYSISYNDNNQITEISNDNTFFTKEYSYDDYGNNTIDKETSNNEKETLITNEYDDKSNLLVQKNSLDYYTFHTYNNYNELIHSVYPSGLTRKLEYGTYGNISKSLFMLNNKKDGASFTYDSKNRLKELLVQNNTKYQYSYDNYNRLSSFSFINGNNSQPIISYGYNKTINNQATELITEKKYFNSNIDKYNFSYNDKRLLTAISYNNGTRFIYSYDSSDRLISINDIENNSETSMLYDNDDNLISRTLTDSHNNEVLKEKYHYDSYGNIQQKVIICENDKRSYDYDYKEEYGEYNLASYLSRLSTSTLNDYVSSVDVIPMYGKEPLYINGKVNYYDSSIKRKVIRFDNRISGVIYNCSDVNETRIDGKEYSHHKYNKSDWINAFNDKKGIFGWFRFNTNTTITKNIYSFLPYNTLAGLYISNNYLYLKLHNESIDINTNLEVDPNTWNLIGMCIEENKITIILNNNLFTRTQNVNISVSDIDIVEICYNVNGSTCTDLLYLNIGPSFDDFNFDKVYNDGFKYLTGFSSNKRSATLYYNQDAYSMCDVITLNGSFTSRDGIEPINFSLTDSSFTKDKTQLFKYDEELHRHVYGSYSNYKSYVENMKSMLAYKVPYTNSGTISMWFKLDSGTYNHSRYIFSIENDNNQVLLSCYIDSLNRLIVHSLNNNDKISLINVNDWNIVSVVWSLDTLMISVNGSCGISGVVNPINVTGATTYIGRKKESTESNNTHLEGKIQLLCYSLSSIDEDDIFKIEDYGYLIDVRKEYDNDDRLIERNINTINHNLTTTYSYYEPDNKLNMLPSNEVDFNNIKTIYAYDEDGNIIEKRILNGSTILKKHLYEYNELKELKKETHYTNNHFDYSYKYEYNINGNRTKVTSYDESDSIISEDNYTYSTIYKDRLESVSHNNTTLYTFNYQGSNFLNPSSITKGNNTYNLSWEGRRLTNIGNTTFSYNEDGIRILKTTPVTATKYYVSGSNVMRSKYNDDNDNEYIIDYHYDEDGILVGLHYDEKEYFYKKDILGIINEIIDEEGTPFVYYKYTAYGIPTKTINTNLSQNKQLIANILLNHNIYIYKDYIYDRDIELYYLNSRYYDPYIGRFISIDAIEYLDIEIVNGLNLYAYCGNNPVMFSDEDGYFWDTVFDILFICWDIYNLCTDNGYKDWKNWVALGIDVIFATVPFFTGGGQVIEVTDVVDDIMDIKKVTIIGESMDRVKDTAMLFDCVDNLYDGFKYYDKLNDLGKGGKVLAEIGGKTSNIAWLYGKLRSGYKVVDIGIDIGRTSRSASYILERLFVAIWKSRNIWKGFYHLLY